MPTPNKILIIDYNPDSAALLRRTLLRKFPQTTVQECKEMITAAKTLRAEKIDVIILHRTEENNAVSLIEMIRQISPEVPVIAVSGIDRSEAVLNAGATGFLNYDEWLRIGTVVANVLGLPQSSPPFPVEKAGPGPRLGRRQG